MGFRVDDDDKTNDDDSNKKNGLVDNNNDIDPHDMNSNDKLASGQNHDKIINDKKSKFSLNKKLNPKEIKQLYIKNMKLQADLDKMKEREKQYEHKLQAKEEEVEDLRDQVNLKNQVLRQLNDQYSKSEDADNLNKKVQELERLLVEKDTSIQALRQEMMKIQYSFNTNISNGNLSPRDSIRHSKSKINFTHV